MKKLLLLFVGLMMAQWAVSQTIVVLNLPNPCSGTGVEEWNTPPTALTFDVYPNPTDDEVTLVVSSAFNSLGKITVEVTDIRGRVLLKKEFYSVHDRLQTLFGLEALETGMYVITLRSEEGIVAKKIVKK